MSYDLKLFSVPDGLEPRAAYEQLIKREEDRDASLPQPLSSSARAAMQQLANALVSCWPSFVPFRPALPQPFIELNDENLEIHLAIYEQTASITLPYFRERAEEKMHCIECCLTACRKERGYVAYDPQLGRVVTVKDLGEIAKGYRGMDQTLPVIRGKVSNAKPWWKFW